jgi:predicted dienelactone hydrolase
MMWFGRRLAAKGYIVAAVDHHGNTAAEPGFDPRGFRMPWERARDISAMIDALLADPVFGPQIDPARIGGAGYSLGGYTMAALAGGMTSLSGFQSFCSSANRDATCDPQPEFPQADEKFAAMLESDPSLAVSLATHAQPFTDARIKSFVLIAPALAQAITDESLLRISAPVLVIAASADSIAPAATNARRFADKIRTSTYRSFDSARHFAFLNECSPKGGKRIPVCRDAPGVDRSAIHDEAALLAVNHFGASFSEGRP